MANGATVSRGATARRYAKGGAKGFISTLGSVRHPVMLRALLSALIVFGFVNQTDYGLYDLWRTSYFGVRFFGDEVVQQAGALAVTLFGLAVVCALLRKLASFLRHGATWLSIFGTLTLLFIGWHCATTDGSFLQQPEFWLLMLATIVLGGIAVVFFLLAYSQLRWWGTLILILTMGAIIGLLHSLQWIDVTRLDQMGWLGQGFLWFMLFFGSSIPQINRYVMALVTNRPVDSEHDHHANDDGGMTSHGAPQ